MLLSSIVLIILLTASILKRDFSILLSKITLANLLLMFFINYNSNYLSSIGKGLSLYNGLYQCSSNSHIFNMFIIVISFTILTLTSYYPRKIILEDYKKTFMENPMVTSLEKPNKSDENKHYDKLDVELRAPSTVNKSSFVIDKKNDQFKILEYPLLILFILCGAVFLMSSNDIVSIFISIELQSYGLYLLCSVYRNSESSTKAGLTYFLLGGLSSCFIILSQALLYINSGNTNLENIYIIYNISTLDNTLLNITNDSIFNSSSFYSIFYINSSLIILSVGFLFKVSAAPFHFWSPDVYDGVPTLVTTYIAIVAKISIFIFLLELVYFTNSVSTEELSSYNWNKNILLSSLLSLLIGTILGLTQSRIKRLYAYSTISHVGFILLALSINSTESIQAFIFYILQYSVSNLNAFIILISIGYLLINFHNNSKEYSQLKETNNSPVQLISQIKGLHKINIMLALSFSIALFSFLGVPPLIGFFGKQMVLSASLDSGYIFMSLVAILTSVISAVYYLIIIKYIFFDKVEYKNITLEQFSKYILTSNNIDDKLISSEANLKSEIEKVEYFRLSGNLTAIISILTLLTLIFMFVPHEVISMVKILSLLMTNV